MKKNKIISIKRKIALIIGAGMAISNLMLLALLLYNMWVSMAGFEIEVNGEILEYHFADNFEKKLVWAGVVIAVLTTVLGVIFTSYFVKLELKPLKKLSDHMATVDKYNLVEKIEMETPIKETEDFVKSFNNMTIKVKEAFQNQKNLTSFIAHELRTPLTVIQTKIDVYKKIPEDERDTDALVTMMEMQIKKLTLLINRILEFANIQGIELNELVPIYILIEEVFDDLEEIADEKNIRLTLENGSNMPKNSLMDVEVKGNHELLYQAFYNIIENAIKYNNENGVVDVIISVENNNKIYVKIKDTGCGIPLSEQDKIFEPFYRCQNDWTKNNKGSGIGLALTKKILEHHRGRIYLRETYDYNNCFEVILDRYVR